LIYLLSAYQDPHAMAVYEYRPPLIPVNISKIDGKYLISEVYDKDYDKFLGKEIISINGEKIKNLLSIIITNLSITII